MLAWGFSFWMWRLTWHSASCSCCLQKYVGPGQKSSRPDCNFISVWDAVVLWDFSLWYEHVLELLVPGFGRPILLCRGKMPRAQGMAAYVWDDCRASSQPKFVCGCCKMLVFRVCGVRPNLCVFSLYCKPWPRWPDFLLFTSINGCRADRGYSCLFPVCGWFERWSSRVDGLYNHELSWNCSFWLRNYLLLHSVGCRQKPCMWWCPHCGRLTGGLIRKRVPSMTSSRGTAHKKLK